MAIDRPDVWPDEAAAVATLSKWFSELNGDQALSIERAGWVLFKHDHDEGLTEYSLMRNVLDYTIDTINGEADIFNWTRMSQLLNVGLDIEDED